MNELIKKIKFPEGFLWGASTSSHQVEGNNFNNWSRWERENASRLAAEAKDRWSEWQQNEFPKMFSSRNYISDLACDHYNKYEEDFDLAASLGQNAHRFSIEWSRIEPEEGRFNDEEIEHYRRVIIALRERNMEPFITLYHWTHPLWFEDKGAWLINDAPKYFTRYAARLAESFKNLDVKFWITVNEPLVLASNSYFKGIWPPQKKSFFKYITTIRHLARAHKMAFRAVKKINPEANIGIAKNNIYFEAVPGLLNKILKTGADWWWNFHFLNKIRHYQDFIGLNYYFHNRVDGGFNKNINTITTDIGWELYPEGIYQVLCDLKKYKKPVYITEHGLADAKDIKRTRYIKESLKGVSRAISEGIDCRGYFHWSLLDNFEWDKGFWPRFGLIKVDYDTMQRIIRPSAYKFAEICKNNFLME